ncbi:hypothetical protein [Dapis sp. BLCC M229]|uniref:hypothetical protein n=1 Tax=Dapis sp. BLCC M229 TaxID=3400188 RepID=UPI003CED7EE0
MGKLTESLQETTQQLKNIKKGINQMQLLGDELTENSFMIAETALKVGYNYAQSEIDATTTNLVESQAQLPSSNVLDRELLKEANNWTEKSLKARFKNCNSAYKYLKDTHGIKLSSRSWKQVVTAFNNGTNKKTETGIEPEEQDLKQQVKFLEKRIITLENQVKEQSQLIQQLISQFK